MRNLSAIQPSSTIKAYYTLNGNSNDISGNSLTGSDTAVTYVKGKFGRSARFNGTTSVINCGSSTTFNLSTFTIHAWINGNNFATNYRIIVAKQITGNFYGFNVGVTTGLFPNFNIQSSAASQSIQSSIAISTGTWNLISVTYSGGVSNIYVNGRFAGRDSTGVTIAYEVSNLQIGNRQSSTTAWFDGLIDEVVIDSKVWAVNEIQTYYNKSNLNYKDRVLLQMVYTYTSELLKGAYTLTGKNISTITNYVRSLLKGSYTLTGKQLTTTKGYVVQLLKGVYTLVGKSIRVPTRWSSPSKSTANYTNQTKSAENWTNQDKS